MKTKGRAALLGFSTNEKEYQVVIEQLDGKWWQYWIFNNERECIREGTTNWGVVFCHMKAAAAFLRVQRNQNKSIYIYRVEVEE